MVLLEKLSLTSGQKYSTFLRNLQVCYHVQKTPLHGSIVNLMDPVYTHFLLRLSSGLLPEILYTFLFTLMYATCPVHPIVLYVIFDIKCQNKFVFLNVQHKFVQFLYLVVKPNGLACIVHHNLEHASSVN